MPPVELEQPIDESTERGKDFEIPDGNYLVSIANCEEKKPKGGGNTFVQLELEIVDIEKKANEETIGLSVYDALSLSAEAAWRMADFLDAAFPPSFKGSAIPDEITDGRLLVIRARKEEYEGKERTRVNKFKAAANWKGVKVSTDSEGKEIIESGGDNGRGVTGQGDDDLNM